MHRLAQGSGDAYQQEHANGDPEQPEPLISLVEEQEEAKRKQADTHDSGELFPQRSPTCRPGTCPVTTTIHRLGQLQRALEASRDEWHQQRYRIAPDAEVVAAYALRFANCEELGDRLGYKRQGDRHG